MVLFKKNKKEKPHAVLSTGKKNDVFTQEQEKLEKELAAQDEQIRKINEAEGKYKDDIDALIIFWEEIWKNGGLLFNGSKWMFRLPDLYIKQKRYDDALRILNKIKNPIYAEKKQSYYKRIINLKEKSAKQ